VLGVPPTATLAEIKSRYLYLSLALERGKFSSRQDRQVAEAQFKLIEEAYRALVDQFDKAQPDRARAAKVEPRRGSPAEMRPPLAARESPPPTISQPLPARWKALLLFLASLGCFLLSMAADGHWPHSAPSFASLFGKVLASFLLAFVGSVLVRGWYGVIVGVGLAAAFTLWVGTPKVSRSPEAAKAGEQPVLPESDDSEETVSQESEWQAAKAAEAANQVESMVEHARKLVEKHPQSGLAYRCLSDALYYTAGGAYDQTLAAANRAIELDPGNPVGWNDLAVIYHALGRSTDSEQAFQKALQVCNEKEPKPFADLAAHYLQEKRPADAASATAKAEVLLTAGSFNAHHGELVECWVWDTVGNNYLSLNRFDPAIAAFQHATELSPSNSKAWFGLGVSYVSKGMWKDAVRPLEKATSLDAQFTDAWLEQGIALLNGGQKNDALDAFKKAAAIKAKDPNVWKWLGGAYAALERWTESESAYARAIEIEPSDGDAWQGLGNSYRQRRDFKESVRAYRKTVQFKPAEYTVWLALAADLKETGEMAQAAAAEREGRAAAALVAGDRQRTLQERKDALQGLYQELDTFRKGLRRDDALGIAYYNTQKARYEALHAQLEADIAAARNGPEPQ
jgi:Flp pilus assembly protein TadD